MDHEDEKVCACKRNEARKERRRNAKEEGGAGGGCRGTDPSRTASPTLGEKAKGSKRSRKRKWRPFDERELEGGSEIEINQVEVASA